MIETPWKDLLPEIRNDLTSDLTRGNHFVALAPTGQGKTTLATLGLVPMFENVADVLILDSTADPKLKNIGKPYQKYGKIKGVRRLTVSDISRETALKIHKALARAYKQGEIVVLVDEIRHLTDKQFFGLKADAEEFLLFSRKRRAIMGGLTQAPRWIPSAFYDQPKLHFIFKIRDKRAMLRLAEIGGDYDRLKEIVPTLGRYEFAYVNPDGDVTTSRFDLPRKRTGNERVNVARPLPTPARESRIKINGSANQNRVNPVPIIAIRKGGG